MDEKLIIELINEKNKWWKDEFKVEFKHRGIYEKVKKFLDARQIISFTGLRRVGKTTMMFKIIEDLIEKYGKDNVFYFSFDELKNIHIRNIINLYKEIKNKDTSK